MRYMMMRSPQTGEIELVAPDQTGILHIKALSRAGWRSVGDVMVTADISGYDLKSGLLYRSKMETQKAYEGQRQLREELRRVRGWADESELPQEERWPDPSGKEGREGRKT